jgi:hypothetical protein
VTVNKWLDGGNMLWFVLGENGSLWLSTASFSRKGAIQQWENETEDDWPKWRRKGFRCQRIKLKYQVQP